MTRPLYEPTAIAAAKIWAEHVGSYGKPGGWIYSAAGKPICQGWGPYADRLIFLKIVVPKRVRTADGDTIRWAIDWRARHVTG